MTNPKNKFCTAISCMDGRIQIPVIQFMQEKFNAMYVDVITEAGINLILAEQTNSEIVESIINRLSISVNGHNSVGIAVVGHFDCAGNSSSDDQQVLHIKEAVKFVRERTKNIEVIGLWVDENFEVHQL